MTRKDYQLIAEILYNHIADRDLRRDVANQFVITLKLDNPKFDVSRFLRACGLMA